MVSDACFQAGGVLFTLGLSFLPLPTLVTQRLFGAGQRPGALFQPLRFAGALGGSRVGALLLEGIPVGVELAALAAHGLAQLLQLAAALVEVSGQLFLLPFQGRALLD